MPDLPTSGLVLADADSVMTLIFVAFAVISWIIKLVNAAKGEAAPPAAGPKPRPPRPKSLEDEIANFLKEVNTKNKGAAEAGGGREAAGRSEVIFEERPRATAPRPTAVEKPKRTQPSPPKTPPKAKDSRLKGGDRSQPAAAKPPKKPIAPQAAAGAERRVSGHAAELGQGVQSHLKAHMSERIGEMVSQDLAPRISDSVQSHLGSGNSLTTAATVAKVPEHPLLSELRQPKTLQRAMVASLILAPPRALANRR